MFATPFAITLWLVGAFLFGLLAAFGWQYIRRAQPASLPLGDADLSEKLRQLESRLQALQTEYQAQQQQYDLQKDQLQRLQRQYVEQESELMLLRPTQQKYERLLQQQSDPPSDHSQVLKALEAEKQRLQDQLTATREKQSLIAEIQAEKAALNEELLSLQAQASRQQEDLAEALHRENELQLAKAELEKKLNQRKRKLDLIRKPATEPTGHPPATRNSKAPAKESPAPTPTAPRQQDDLKRINGIGPALEKKLHALGIFRFEQIAGWKETDIDLIGEYLGGFPGRIRRDAWVAQARQWVESQDQQEEATLARIKLRAQEMDWQGLGAISSGQADELTRIEGIDAFTARKLNQAGIYTFAQLASLNRAEAERLNEVIECFPGRIWGEKWPEQAKQIKK